MSAILSAGRPRYQSRRLPLKSPGAKAREIRPRRASQDLKIRLDVQKWMIGCFFFQLQTANPKNSISDSFFEKTFLTVFVWLGILIFWTKSVVFWGMTCFSSTPQVSLNGACATQHARQQVMLMLLHQKPQNVPCRILDVKVDAEAW